MMFGAMCLCTIGGIEQEASHSGLSAIKPVHHPRIPSALQVAEILCEGNS